MMQNIMFA